MKSHFAVSYSIMSAAALTAEILPQFGIHEGATCEFFTGGFNDTYRVRTAQGPNYYLRVYRARWRTLPDILYELDVLKHLERKVFAAARPVSRFDGSLVAELAAPEGTRYAALFTEVPGKLISYDQEPAQGGR